MPEKKKPSRKSIDLPTQEYLSKLGNRVRSLRIAAGYTSYDQLAYELGINRSQWGRYENGNDLKYTTLLKVVGAFGMTLQEFFSEGFD
jgi:transcriptional regulator with XRE-family HTH domain